MPAIQEELLQLGAWTTYLSLHRYLALQSARSIPCPPLMLGGAREMLGLPISNGQNLECHRAILEWAISRLRPCSCTTPPSKAYSSTALHLLSFPAATGLEFRCPQCRIYHLPWCHFRVLARKLPILLALKTNSKAFVLCLQTQDYVQGIHGVEASRRCFGWRGRFPHSKTRRSLATGGTPGLPVSRCSWPTFTAQIPRNTDPWIPGIGSSGSLHPSLIDQAPY